jgi:hypothetical protein
MPVWLGVGDASGVLYAEGYVGAMRLFDGSPKDGRDSGAAEPRKLDPVSGTSIWFASRIPPPSSNAAASLWCASKAATAQDTSRLSTESALLVRISGRPTKYDPGGCCAGHEGETLGQHVAGFEIGATSTLARPATAESICLSAAASGIITAFIVSGLSSTASVI